ncbi:Low molecular weight phosphotyrosine protein phosphatase [Lecanora helva]
MSTQPVSVLFVCLGNICRSPMAEAVFRSLTVSHPHIGSVDSAGTGAYHAGDSPDPRTMSTLKDNGVLNYDHAAQKVKATDFLEFDYILAMDEQNLYDLQRLQRRVMAKNEADGSTSKKKIGSVKLFGDFGGQEGEVVIDPYYGARNGFEVAHEQMVRFSKGFISEVLDER